MHEFTERAQNVLDISQAFSYENNHPYIGTEHILYGLIAEKNGLASRLLKKQGINGNIVKNHILSLMKILSTEDKNKNLEYTPRAKRLIENSIKECSNMGHNYISTEHILLALMKEIDSVAVKILIDCNINPQKIFNDLVKLIAAETHLNIPEIKPVAEDTTNLLKYSMDLTKQAKKGKFDNITGREEEINKLVQILSKKTKNNVVILGNPGVGKTSLVEGLAKLISKKQVPHTLQDKKIISLDLMLMVAGAKYRGDFEERLKLCIDEVKKAGNIIVFIDEVHNIIGAGSAEGAMDAASILKPLITSGSIRVIGATTLEEYKVIEKDVALDRRFSKVELNEPSKEATINILKGVKKSLEKHHEIKIANKLLEDTYSLTSRYILDRYMPEKAIDVLDEACSLVVMNNKTSDNNIKTNKLQLSDIENVVSIISKLPVSKLTLEEKSKLINIEQRIKKKIIGQDQAIDSVTKAIKRARIGLKDIKRPVGSFMFLGPTGVGKTALAKSLAEELFGSEDSMIRFDMSEYMESHSISKLIGAPPGYIGYDKEGLLTSKVRKNPYSIVLFDEIEKAHQDIYNILLQILDDGRVTDSSGRVIDFKHTIIIITSNVGANKIITKSKVGFLSNTDNNDDISSEVQKEVKKVFKPEFLNRIDELIIFNKLSSEALSKITTIQLEEINRRLKLRKITIKFSENIIERVIKEAVNEEYGARPIRRYIIKHIENYLADELLKTNIKEGEKLKLEYINDNLKFSKITV